jgi:hypothetical protein
MGRGPLRVTKRRQKIQEGKEHRENHTTKPKQKTQKNTKTKNNNTKGKGKPPRTKQQQQKSSVEQGAQRRRGPHQLKPSLK